MDFSTTPILYYKMSTSNLRLLYLKFPMGTPRTMLLKNGGHTACQRSYIDLMFGANDGQAAINLSHFCIYVHLFTHKFSYFDANFEKK